MTQYHEGQDVEVLYGSRNDYRSNAHWDKAKIIMVLNNGWLNAAPDYQVAFPDGTRAVFDTDHIRDIVVSASCIRAAERSS